MKTVLQTTEKNVTVEITKTSDKFLALVFSDGEFWFEIGYYATEKNAIKFSEKKLKPFNIELVA